MTNEKSWRKRAAIAGTISAILTILMVTSGAGISIVHDQALVHQNIIDLQNRVTQNETIRDRDREKINEMASDIKVIKAILERLENRFNKQEPK